MPHRPIPLPWDRLRIVHLRFKLNNNCQFTWILERGLSLAEVVAVIFLSDLIVRLSMRIAVLLKDRCQPKKCNAECRRYCPKVRTGVEVVVMGDDGRPNLRGPLRRLWHMRS